LENLENYKDRILKRSQKYALVRELLQISSNVTTEFLYVLFSWPYVYIHFTPMLQSWSFLLKFGIFLTLMTLSGLLCLQASDKGSRTHILSQSRTQTDACNHWLHDCRMPILTSKQQHLTSFLIKYSNLH